MNRGLDGLLRKSSAAIISGAPQGRLTLTTATPIMTSDVMAATTVYYTPYAGNLVPIFTGLIWGMTTFAELSLALDSSSSDTGYHQSGKNFDLFVTQGAGGQLALGTGPAWTSDTVRGTGAGTTELERVRGLWTNKNPMVLRVGLGAGDIINVQPDKGTYAGSMRASANGQCSWTIKPAASAGGTECKIFLWNAYNRLPTFAICQDSTDSWSYSTGTTRAKNNSATNRISFVRGLDEDTMLGINSMSIQTNTGASQGTASGSSLIGLDSTTTPAADAYSTSLGGYSSGGSNVSLVQYYSIVGYYTGAPGLGLHYLQALEYANNNSTGVTVWAGDFGVPAAHQAALHAIGAF